MKRIFIHTINRGLYSSPCRHTANTSLWRKKKTLSDCKSRLWLFLLLWKVSAVQSFFEKLLPSSSVPRIGAGMRNTRQIIHPPLYCMYPNHSNSAWKWKSFGCLNSSFFFYYKRGNWIICITERQTEAWKKAFPWKHAINLFPSQPNTPPPKRITAESHDLPADLVLCNIGCTNSLKYPQNISLNRYSFYLVILSYKKLFYFTTSMCIGKKNTMVWLYKSTMACNK